MRDKDPLNDVNQLSLQLGWSVSTIYRRRSNGDSLPRAVKFGNAVRWRQSDIDSWIAEQLEPAC